MTRPLTVDGVDISRYQSGPFDWRAAARAGVKFAYHKVTEGLSYPAEHIALYTQRRAAVEAAGIAYGGYHFARPKTGRGREEAAYFLSKLRFRAGDLRPMLDLETAEGLSRSALTSWVRDFAAEVHRATGVHPVLYLSRQISLDGDPVVAGLPLWVPRYSDSNSSPYPLPAPFRTHAVWQFSNGAYGVPDSVAGVGHVDLNTFGPGFRLADLLTPRDAKPNRPEPRPKPPAVSGDGRVRGSNLTPTANAFITAARAEVGYREGYDNDTKFAAWSGHANHAPWCATFLDGVSDHATGLGSLVPEGQSMASCDLLYQSFQARRRVSEYPAVGAIFFLGTPGGTSTVAGRSMDLHHTGLVVAYDADSIYTVEGNTNDDGSSNGDGVYARVRPRRGSSVAVYAYPAYPEGIISADPAWRDRAPKPATPIVHTRRLVVAHASMQFSDPTEQQRADVAALFGRAREKGWAWVTGTEASTGSGNKISELLRAGADAHGYRYYRAPASDSWVAVDRGLIAGGWETGYSGTIVEGIGTLFGDKGIAWVSFDTKSDLGDLGRVTVAAAHLLTPPALERVPDGNRRINARLGALAVEKGRGRDLFFYGGDQNTSDRLGDTFTGAPLTSAADEVGRWEDTGKSPLDVVASYDADGRVKAVNAWTLDDSELPLHSDHFVAVGEYEVGVL